MTVRRIYRGYVITAPSLLGPWLVVHDATTYATRATAWAHVDAIIREFRHRHAAREVAAAVRRDEMGE